MRSRTISHAGETQAASGGATPIIQLTVVILLLVGVLLRQSGCRKAKPPLRDEVKAYYPERLRYFLSEYEQHGKKNSRWDSAMRQLIEEHIHLVYIDSHAPPTRLVLY